MRTSLAALVVSIGAMLVVACSASDTTEDSVSAVHKKRSVDASSDTLSDDSPPGPPGSQDDAGGMAAAKAGAPGSTTGTCPHQGPLLPVDGFAPCRVGGRCVPEGVVPVDQRAQLAACAGSDNAKGFCVPEKILANEGNYLPKACTSLAGGEGRCLSRVFPDIDKQKDELPKDACEDTERCAPCYDPVSGNDTGACRSVSCDAPKKPKVVFKNCCIQSGKPRGRCVPKSTIPTSDQGGLDQKECDSASLCAPSEQLDSAFKNPRCTADSLLGTYSGVCVSTCVKTEWYTDLVTDQGNCKAGFFCAPCKNPIDDSPTGAPNCP